MSDSAGAASTNSEPTSSTQPHDVTDTTKTTETPTTTNTEEKKETTIITTTEVENQTKTPTLDNKTAEEDKKSNKSQESEETQGASTQGEGASSSNTASNKREEAAAALASDSDSLEAAEELAEEIAELEHSPQERQNRCHSMSSQTNINLNNSITSVNSSRSATRSFSGFPPIRFTRSIQNSNWREHLSNNFSSVIQEFRPVFQMHNNNNNNNNSSNNGSTTNTNNRGIIANLSNYRVPSNNSFRYIDSPASETNPPNYSNDSFVINFDNHVHGNSYRGTNRPSLTDSLRLEHTHDLHTSGRSDAGGDHDDSRGGGGFSSDANESGPEPPREPHEHTEGNLTETIAQFPEAASVLDTLSRYVPYVCILLAKSCYDHLDGILDFFALFVTFYHANKVVRQEVTKQNQRSIWNLLRAFLFIAIVVAVIGFMLDKKNIPITLLISGSLSEPFTLKSLMFAIGINDLILKLITVAMKIVITLIPPAFIDYKGRGRIYLMTEAMSQFLRSLVTTHPWLLFLLDSYQGTEKIMGVILSGAYIVAKGSDLLQRIKFCKHAFIKLLQKVCIGVIPTKEQIQQTGGLCTICHDNFNSPAMLDCGHIFCELCIGTWLDRATVCPLCRAKISDDPSFRDGSTTFFIQLY